MSAPVDVLAVMDDGAATIEAYGGGLMPQADDLREARAAVAELIDAAEKAKSAMDSIWKTRGRDDEFIYDEMGSELSNGYFAMRESLTLVRGEK